MVLKGISRTHNRPAQKDLRNSDPKKWYPSENREVGLDLCDARKWPQILTWGRAKICRGTPLVLTNWCSPSSLKIQYRAPSSIEHEPDAPEDEAFRRLTSTTKKLRLNLLRFHQALRLRDTSVR